MDFHLLISIVVGLCILGVICYCITLIPGLPDPIKRIAQIVIILIGCLWLLGKSGLM